MLLLGSMLHVWCHPETDAAKWNMHVIFPGKTWRGFWILCDFTMVRSRGVFFLHLLFHPWINDSHDTCHLLLHINTWIYTDTWLVFHRATQHKGSLCCLSVYSGSWRCATGWCTSSWRRGCCMVCCWTRVRSSMWSRGPALEGPPPTRRRTRRTWKNYRTWWELLC